MFIRKNIKMAKFDIIMPKLGESIIEATITRWMKNEGDNIAEDDAIVEIATDKVDSEIPSPVEGILLKRFYNEGDVVAVGAIIAQIATNSEVVEDSPVPEVANGAVNIEEAKTHDLTFEEVAIISNTSDRFYSPLVKSIAKQEGLSNAELDKIAGSGLEGRVTKDDLLHYLKNPSVIKEENPDIPKQERAVQPQAAQPKVVSGVGDQIVEMDRMRKMIADHMVMSKQVSAHVTSFIEVDMTNVVMWRNSVKDSFQKREGEKITFTPVFIEAAAKAIKDYPGVNASVDGNKIILRKNINIGMATSLPNGNLIVPVIKNADQKNLLGIAKTVNDLANRSRNNKLSPDDIQDGTFTITNLGSFGSITGTPIINQPQVAILAVGAIQKKPVVIETPTGDSIGIRYMMILSLSYDHRVVDGGMGGLYIKRVAEYLQNFDVNTTI